MLHSAWISQQIHLHDSKGIFKENRMGSHFSVCSGYAIGDVAVLPNWAIKATVWIEGNVWVVHFQGRDVQ